MNRINCLNTNVIRERKRVGLHVCAMQPLVLQVLVGLTATGIAQSFCPHSTGSSSRLLRDVPPASASAIGGGDDDVCTSAEDDGRRDFLRDFLLSLPLPSFASPVYADADAAYATTTSISDSHILTLLTDPNTYSALAYSPPDSQQPSPPPPLLLVLPGAAENAGTAWDLADINGEHRGLPASLLAAGQAPASLAEQFAVISLYPGQKIRSIYDEPRGKILQFVQWLCDQSSGGSEAGVPRFNPESIFLLGFSDGATLSIELLTTGRFRGGIVAAYGFTGTLPQLALDRLKGKPIWVFHSADDAIFPVLCSDHLVESLRKVNSESEDSNFIRYTRFDKDQEGFTGRVRGHSTGITASKRKDIYDWMLAFSYS